MNIDVSIIVPCYNMAPYLDACLETLVNQTLKNIEIICVNDGSTDDTPLLLDKWAARDARIQVINQVNGGLSAARNTGMDAATGEYVGFMDPDDYADVSMFGRLLETARELDTDVSACGYHVFSDRDGQMLEQYSRAPEAGMEPDAQSSCFSFNSLWLRMDPVAWNKLYKRSFLESQKLRFEPAFRRGEDDVFWLMALPFLTRLAVIPDQLYFYRKQREGSISYQWEENGCPYDLDMERLLHVTAFWKKIGWLEAALERGWMFYLVRQCVLLKVTARDSLFSRLNHAEQSLLYGKCREWAGLMGDLPLVEHLDRWDGAFCRLLGSPPEQAGWVKRLVWKIRARGNGRRGRYYALKLVLARLSDHV